MARIAPNRVNALVLRAMAGVQPVQTACIPRAYAMCLSGVPARVNAACGRKGEETVTARGGIAGSDHFVRRPETGCGVRASC